MPLIITNGGSLDVEQEIDTCVKKMKVNEIVLYLFKNFLNVFNISRYKSWIQTRIISQL